jgi:hypothetical protein
VAFGTTVPVDDYAVVADSRRNRHTAPQIREEECSGEKFRSGWPATGQLRWSENGPDRHGGRIKSCDGLIENVFVRLFVRNLRHGFIGNLIAATGTCGDLAVSQEEFTEVKANSSARPKNRVTHAIRKINLAGFGGANDMSAAEIEVSEVAANHIVPQGRVAEIVGIFHASRYH